MAIKKIQMKPEGINDYTDTLYPETSADQVIANDGKTVENKVKDLGGYAVASGTNTYIVTLTGIASLVEGTSFKVKFTNANTSASTLNINGLGAKSIVKSNGNALTSGNIKAGQICNLVYGGVNFQLLGEGGEYGTATASDVLSGKTIGTEAGLVSGAMVNQGAKTLTPGASSVAIPAGYHNGSGIVSAVVNLSAGNIKSGVNVGGVVGTVKPAQAFTVSNVLALNNGNSNGLQTSTKIVAENTAAGATTNAVLIGFYGNLSFTSTGPVYCKSQSGATADGVTSWTGPSSHSNLVFNPNRETMTWSAVGGGGAAGVYSFIN